MQRRSLLAASAFASFACGIGVPIRALAEDLTQGITKDEVLLGTVQDLSGPVVSITKPTLNGTR
jgi:hypothetical protein